MSHQTSSECDILHLLMASSLSSRFAKPAFALWCLTLAIVLIVRILAPSDLGQNLDQSKTIAFTLDMVQNNQWILPRDSLGHLTRKPPMVNWLGAPFVAMGIHSELALKLPAVISGVSISILIFFAARFLFRKLNTEIADLADITIASHATPLAFFASAAWLASPSAIKHIYFMRPDILFTALLVIAWFASVFLLSSENPKHPKRLALLIWLLAAAAALTKGPLALLIPLYLILHILIITPKPDRKSTLARTSWQWGIPLMLILPGIWLWAAYRINPDHITNTLLGKELGSRVGRGGFTGIFKAALANPAYFFERFLPWCIPAALAIISKPSSRIRTHPIAPATLWVLLVLTTTTIVGMKSGSYIMPAYPAAAILAVYALFRIITLSRAKRAAAPFVFISILIILSATLITVRESTMSRGAKTNTGEFIKEFARSVSQLVGKDDVHFVELGDIPIASLMGRHHSDDLTQFKYVRWNIQPTNLDPSQTPVLVSDPIVTHDPDTGEPIDITIQIGLYKSN